MDGTHRFAGLRPRPGRVSVPGRVYLITVVSDARAAWFREHDAARAAARIFHSPAVLGDSRMLAWVLMPDHAHWLVQLGGDSTLQSLVHRLKAASAFAARRALQRHVRIWQRGYHDHALREDQAIITVARHVVAHPLRAGLVSRLGDYPYWNAIWVG